MVQELKRLYFLNQLKTILYNKVIPYKNGIGIKKIEFLPLVIDVGKTYSEHGESEYELI